MNKVIVLFKKLYVAVTAMTKAIFTPLILVIEKSLKGESITMGQLCLAFWRLIVWVAFMLCLTGNIGVPVIIVYLFLMDIVIIGFQTVFFVVK